jgi:hypothetical protein
MLRCQEKLDLLNKADGHMMQNAYSLANSDRHIKDDWRATAQYGLGPKIMVIIDILSQALCGQHLLGEDLLDNARKARIERGGASEPRDYQESDSLDTIKNL